MGSGLGRGCDRRNGRTTVTVGLPAWWAVRKRERECVCKCGCVFVCVHACAWSPHTYVVAGEVLISVRAWKHVCITRLWRPKIHSSNHSSIYAHTPAPHCWWRPWCWKSRLCLMAGHPPAWLDAPLKAELQEQTKPRLRSHPLPVAKAMRRQHQRVTTPHDRD